MDDGLDPGATARADAPFRVLSLDGGGAKGFYSLGALRGIEALAGRPLHEAFHLVFGTSTGAIIAALIGLGRSVEEIRALYEKHVVGVMALKSRAAKTAALEKLAKDVFSDATFADMRTRVGIVATRWDLERPMIFKSAHDQSHGRKDTFAPGFGVAVRDAVVASCSAYPFFEKRTVVTSEGFRVELVDGGYCANNPTLYAIADALQAVGRDRSALRVVSVGVGVYPEPRRAPLTKMWLAQKLQSVQLLQKTLEINTQSMEQLRQILYGDVETVRLNEKFERPELATDLLEHDLAKLNLLRQRGAETFAGHETALARVMRDM